MITPTFLAPFSTASFGAKQPALAMVNRRALWPDDQRHRETSTFSSHHRSSVAGFLFGDLPTLPWAWESNVPIKGIAPLGTLDPQHAVAQFAEP
jgi:hypothetical protein